MQAPTKLGWDFVVVDPQRLIAVAKGHFPPIGHDGNVEPLPLSAPETYTIAPDHLARHGETRNISFEPLHGRYLVRIYDRFTTAKMAKGKGTADTELRALRDSALDAVHVYKANSSPANEERLAKAVHRHDELAFSLDKQEAVPALQDAIEAILYPAHGHQHGAGLLAHGTHEERKALVHAAGHELRQATRKFLKRAVLSPVESLLAKAHPYEQLLAKEVAHAPAHAFHRAWKKLATHYGNLKDSHIGGSFFSHAFHKISHGIKHATPAIGRELKHASRKAFEFAKSPFEIASNLQRAAVRGTRQLADSDDVIGQADRAADVAKKVADVAASVETGGASAATS